MNRPELPTPITSADNPQFKALKKLAGSGRERRKAGQTLLDGIHLIEAWMFSGHAAAVPGDHQPPHAESPRSQRSPKIVLSAAGARRPDNIAWLATHPELRVLVLADSMFAELTEGDQTATGLLALVTSPTEPPAPRHDVDTLALDGVQDPGNVGTILRTAAAAGFAQAVLSSDCAQAWSPKVLRAGMGAHFALTVCERIELPAFLEQFSGTVAVTDLAGETSLYEAEWSSPVCWVFGSEGEGVSPAVRSGADLRVRIPMPGRTESLNVAAAAALCLFETVRRQAHR